MPQLKLPASALSFWVADLGASAQRNALSVSVAVIKDYAKQYRAEAKKHGRKPYVVLMRDCVIGESWDACVAKSGPTMVTHRWYFRYGAYVMDDYIKDIKDPEELSFDVAKKDRLIAGSPLEWRRFATSNTLPTCGPYTASLVT